MNILILGNSQDVHAVAIKQAITAAGATASADAATSADDATAHAHAIHASYTTGMRSFF